MSRASRRPPSPADAQQRSESNWHSLSLARKPRPSRPPACPPPAAPTAPRPAAGGGPPPPTPVRRTPSDSPRRSTRRSAGPPTAPRSTPARTRSATLVGNVASGTLQRALFWHAECATALWDVPRPSLRRVPLHGQPCSTNGRIRADRTMSGRHRLGSSDSRSCVTVEFVLRRAHRAVVVAAVKGRARWCSARPARRRPTPAPGRERAVRCGRGAAPRWAARS